MFIDSEPESVAFITNERAHNASSNGISEKRACPKKSTRLYARQCGGNIHVPQNARRLCSFSPSYHLKRIKPGLSTIGRTKWAKMTVESGQMEVKVVIRHRAGAPTER